MNADEILEAMDDLLFDLRHNFPPTDGDAGYYAAWGETVARVDYARAKLAEAVTARAARENAAAVPVVRACA